MEATAREMVIQELDDMPEIGIFEVLDFVRFLKARLEQLSPEERFDRAWMVARRLATEYGITDQDIAAEVTAQKIALISTHKRLYDQPLFHIFQHRLKSDISFTYDERAHTGAGETTACSLAVTSALSTS